MKSEKQIEKQRREKDALTFSQEVENLFFAESENAFFTYSMLDKARTLKKCWYPTEKLRKVTGELRLISMDVAISGRRHADNTVITLFRLIPSKLGYIRQVVGMYSFNGMNSVVQGDVLKRMFYQFEADYVILDMIGAGLHVYDYCTGMTRDDELDTEYPAWEVMQHSSIKETTYDDLLSRRQGITGIPCVYPVIVTMELNHKIAVQLKTDFEKGLIRLLVDESKAEDEIGKRIANKGKKAEFVLSDINKKIDMMYPYAQTSALIAEMVALETKELNSKVKLERVSGKRKDRYSSLSYCNWFASMLDKELLKEFDESSGWESYSNIFGKNSF